VTKLSHVIVGIKGFFVGIALIIPGLSGGTLAIYLGIYEKLLHSIGHVFSDMKKSLEFLIPLFIGIGVSIVSLASLLGYLIDLNSFVVLLFFMGLIVGGMKDIYVQATKEDASFDPLSVVAAIASFTLVILLVVFGKLSNETGIAYIDISFGSILLLFLLGMAASMTMIVPGVSGSALLIVLGYYTAIVTNVVGNIFDFSSLSYHIQVLIPFALGAGVGIILFSKLIEYALKHHFKQTYFAIFGFLVGSVIAIFFEIKDPSTASTHDLQTPIYKDLFTFMGDNVWSIIIGIILFIIGVYVSHRLTSLELTHSESE
jgi:putative membrane protein